MFRFHIDIRILKVSALVLGITLVPPLLAEQRGEIEEIIVTGSYIKGSPEDAALPVDVITRADLQDVAVLSPVRSLAGLRCSKTVLQHCMVLMPLAVLLILLHAPTSKDWNFMRQISL